MSGDAGMWRRGGLDVRVTRPLLFERVEHALQLARRQCQIAFEIGQRRAGAVEQRFVNALLDLADAERFERPAARLAGCGSIGAPRVAA